MRLVCTVLALTALAAMTAPAHGENPTSQTPTTEQTAASNGQSVAAIQVTAPADSARPAAVRRGNWLIEETENFSICRPLNYRYNASAGEELEKARAELQAAWLPNVTAAPWRPKCQIVLHGSREGYLQAVGRGAEATTGSALVDFNSQGIGLRKIDIRGDRADWFTAALTHELTHVVLADRFITVAIPHWADEGMAILADTPAKRDRHAVDLRDALGAGAEFRLAELLTLGGYPQARRMGAFYGQSASLVAYLTTIGTREQLLAMVERSSSHGYDVALREIYKIESVRHLERDWRQHVASNRQSVAKSSAPAKPAINQTAATAATPATEPTGAAAMD